MLQDVGVLQELEGSGDGCGRLPTVLDRHGQRARRHLLSIVLSCFADDLGAEVHSADTNTHTQGHVSILSKRPLRGMADRTRLVLLPLQSGAQAFPSPAGWGIRERSQEGRRTCWRIQTRPRTQVMAEACFADKVTGVAV